MPYSWFHTYTKVRRVAYLKAIASFLASLTKQEEMRYKRSQFFHLYKVRNPAAADGFAPSREQGFVTVAKRAKHSLVILRVCVSHGGYTQHLYIYVYVLVYVCKVLSERAEYVHAESEQRAGPE